MITNTCGIRLDDTTAERHTAHLQQLLNDQLAGVLSELDEARRLAEHWRDRAGRGRLTAFPAVLPWERA